MSKPASRLSAPVGTWQATALPGVDELVLARTLHDAEVVTRLLRLMPGAHTRVAGVFRHDFWEEVYVIDGALHDLATGETAVAGCYACRPPETPHGPIESAAGCTVLEVRYR